MCVRTWLCTKFSSGFLGSLLKSVAASGWEEEEGSFGVAEMASFCLVSISLSSMQYASIAVFMVALNRDYISSFLVARCGHVTEFRPIVCGEK